MMNKNSFCTINKYLFFATFTILSCCLTQQGFAKAEQLLTLEYPQIQTADSVAALFPKTPDEIDSIYEMVTTTSLEKLQQIIDIAPEERTFENTVLEFDKTLAFFVIHLKRIDAIQNVHPDEAMRNKAEEAALGLTDFIIDQFESNKAVAQAINEYQAGNRLNENLNAERAYYLSNLLSAFHNQGLDLEDEMFEKVIDLKKQISSLEMKFSNNIAQDDSILRVKREDLDGIREDFINTLDVDGNEYILRCDYPTRDQILRNCTMESTRRDFSKVFANRGYPENLTILNQLVNKRDELAKLLGYDSYAQLDTEAQMAKNPETVDAFLDSLTPKALAESAEEWKALLAELPESVVLTEDGKVKPWDVSYLNAQFKKKNLKVDNEKITEYFPMESTLQSLLQIFEKFLGLQFKSVPVTGFWDPSVQMVEVRQVGEEKSSLLGYVVLDLYPRENKFSHACCESVIPPMSFDGGATTQPALAIVIANFSKPTKTKPSLLKHGEVRTFFHEFGHALHALLGHAEMPTQAAYNTTMDFVEAPSQLLEEWMWEPTILKMISRHYLTNEPMSDEQIELLVKSKDFGIGTMTAQQISFAKLSLELFKEGQNKDLLQIQQQMHDIYSPMTSYDPDNHYICSFGHLPGYAAKYYGYLWSKEFALKIFAYIQSHGGLLDPVVGQRYVSKVIGKGGSCDPNELMEDFLGEDR
jgi:thimet oligopeptidase